MKKILIVLLFFVFILILSSCRNNTTTFSSDINTNIEIKELHSELQLRFFNEGYKTVHEYANGKEELSRPLPLRLEYESDKDDNIIKLSENKDLSSATIYHSNTNYIEIYNLKTNQVYYWSINDSIVNSFKTSGGIRNLYIDGVTNARDLGDNINIKQGLMFRSSKLSANYTGSPLITETGILELQALGLKTEIDLRENTLNYYGETEHALTDSVIPGVEYFNIPMTYTSYGFISDKSKLIDLFEILGNENNYPLLFHCAVGADRTGVVSFLIKGLLGCDIEDIKRDYMFTNFANIGSSRSESTIDDFIETVSSESGDTLKIKIYKYLVRNGVNSRDIDNMIRIMSK